MKTPTFIALTAAVICLLAVPATAQVFQTQWQLGSPGRGWPLDGVGGGPDVDFVAESGVNAPPGNPDNPPVDRMGDDDYYFAGSYPAPIGTVDDELAMERAFAAVDNALRIHFNLPETLNFSTLAQFSFEPWNLHIDAALNPDPRYGVEVRFNGELVMSEVIVRPDMLMQIITTDPFFLGDVGAEFGPGGDNVLELTGINYNGAGGGNWMGMDYHALEVSVVPEPSSLGLMIAGGVLALGTLIRRRK